MFKKALLAKFEWDGLLAPLNSLFVENLIYDSSDRNFVVVERPNGKEFWGMFTVLEREGDYGIPTKIQYTTANGSTRSTDDFVLFSNFKSFVKSDRLIVEAHTQIIVEINKALKQHIRASQLIANIYAKSKTEADELAKLYKDFSGIKVLKRARPNMADMDSGAEIVQFEITPRTEELENLKHEIEKDLFLRLGIYTGVDKTHITDHNVEDCEQVEDLLNAYELKLRQDFCERYNKWREAHNISRRLTVKIHAVTAENSISTNISGGGD